MKRFCLTQFKEILVYIQKIKPIKNVKHGHIEIVAVDNTDVQNVFGKFHFKMTAKDTLKVKCQE